MQRFKSIKWIMILVGLLVLSACGGGKDSSDTASADSGTVQLAITSSVDPNPTDAVVPVPTDAVDPVPTGTVVPVSTDTVDPVPTDTVNPDPIDTIIPDPIDAIAANPIEVVISIKEVRAVPAGEEGAEEMELPLIVAYDTPKIVNVQDLAFLQELLGEAVLPAGTYSQLRLVLAANTDALSPANYIILAADPAQKIPLNTPSGQQSGLKIVGEFCVEAEDTTAVVLDFDPAKAVLLDGQSGKWQLKPTGIRVVQSDTLLPSYGTLIGRVEMEVAGDNGTVIRTPVTGAMVFAIPQGSDTAAASVAVTLEDGSYSLLLPAGSYELQVTADGFQPFSSPSAYEVLNGEDTDAGVILLEKPSLQ
jgi:hypothetical protein